MGRTAVIAGTASAVAGGVNRRQRNRWAAQEQQAAAGEQAAYQQGLADAQSSVPPPPAETERDPIEELERLAKLREQGVLTDEEFSAQKARILAG